MQQVSQDTAALAKRIYASEFAPDQVREGVSIYKRRELGCCVAFLPGKTIAVGPLGLFEHTDDIRIECKIEVKDGFIVKAWLT